MKKFIALFIGVLMVTVIFVGCKTTVAKSETASAVTIKTAETGTTVKTTSVATTTAETTTAAAQTTTKANEAASASWTITISGINGKDVNFTDADAAKMSTVEITTTNKKKDGTAVEQKWTGIPLKASN